VIVPLLALIALTSFSQVELTADELARADQARVRAHLLSALEQVAAAPVSHLAPAQRIKRAQLIEALRAYIDAGRYPKNRQVAGLSPVFIDEDDTTCAVAQLVIASGHAPLAHAIAEADNLIDLPAEHAALSSWADDHGFTMAELALIQPSYGFLAPFRRNEKLACDAGKRGYKAVAKALNAMKEPPGGPGDIGKHEPINDNRRSFYADMALECAAKKGKRATVLKLIDDRELLMPAVFNKVTPATARLGGVGIATEAAASGGQLALVKLLVTKHDALSSRRSREYVYAAVKGGHSKVAKWLVRRGAAIDGGEFSAIEAAAAGRTRLAHWLINKGGTVSGDAWCLERWCPKKLNRQIATLDMVHWAIVHRDSKLLKAALDKGAPVGNVSVNSGEPMTALELARYRKCGACVRILKRHEAAIKEPDDDG
jgi:hypothetical protein